MRHLLLLFLLMLLSLRTYGETEQYYNSLVGSQIKVGASVSIAESHVGNYNGTLYDVASSVGLVRLRLDYESVSLFIPPPNSPVSFQAPTIRVEVDVTWTDIAGGTHTIVGKELEIQALSVASDLVRIEGAHKLLPDRHFCHFRGSWLLCAMAVTKTASSCIS